MVLASTALTPFTQVMLPITDSRAEQRRDLDKQSRALFILGHVNNSSQVCFSKSESRFPGKFHLPLSLINVSPLASDDHLPVQCSSAVIYNYIFDS